MQLKTILNRVQRFKSFVYTKARWAGSAEAAELEVEVVERANGQALCSGCTRHRPGYDRLPTRRFEFVPLWGIKVFLVYAPRRVDCPSCGVRVESMPWALGKSPLTKAYAWFLARWARRLSWKEVALVFAASWESVFRSVEMAVEWGRAHQDLSGVRAIGIDEIAWKKGHKYL
ncbi:MAG: ISL3 family transposase, partial [Nitrococcus sp.]|nr:ISL3 family transposase [Nitrococcus sp.]